MGVLWVSNWGQEAQGAHRAEELLSLGGLKGAPRRSEAGMAVRAVLGWGARLDPV